MSEVFLSRLIVVKVESGTKQFTEIVRVPVIVSDKPETIDAAVAAIDKAVREIIAGVQNDNPK